MVPINNDLLLITITPYNLAFSRNGRVIFRFLRDGFPEFGGFVDLDLFVDFIVFGFFSVEYVLIRILLEFESQSHSS